MVRDHSIVRLKAGDGAQGPATIIFVAGEKPYLWFGDEQCLGTLEHSPDIRRLRDFCDAILESKNRRPRRK